MSRIEYLAGYPRSIRGQVDALIDRLSGVVGTNLIGIYLHGSLAMDCFNPETSDLDVLVRVRQALSTQKQGQLIEMLLDLSGNPAPIELSVLSDADLFPWRYPTPYTLHFSEDWRERFESGEGQPAERFDPDLAAHITVLHARGVALLGPPPGEPFPQVPDTDYLDSILRDYEWAMERIEQNPVYAVLNMARVLRYLTDRAVTSKLEAGEWALDVLPGEARPAVSAAVRHYRGETDRFDVDSGSLERFVEAVDERTSASGEGNH